MTDNKAISKDEYLRLDMFVLQSLVKIALLHVFASKPEEAQRLLAEQFEGTIRRFNLTGAAPEKLALCKDYMAESGLRLISDVFEPVNRRH